MKMADQSLKKTGVISQILQKNEAFYSGIRFQVFNGIDNLENINPIASKPQFYNIIFEFAKLNSLGSKIWL